MNWCYILNIFLSSLLSNFHPFTLGSSSNANIFLGTLYLDRFSCAKLINPSSSASFSQTTAATGISPLCVFFTVGNK